MKKIYFILLFFSLLKSLFGIDIAFARDNKIKTIKDLKLIVIITHHSQDVDFFNQILREDDIVFTYGAKINLLKRVAKPKIMIGRGSLSALERELKKLNKHKVKIDYIQYNPEHWKEFTLQKKKSRI
jgi:hypothetical protein